MAFRIGHHEIHREVGALKNISHEAARRELYRDVMPALENQDWNDHHDVFGLDHEFDQV
ncbi:hypothetical protein JQ543_28330 [Bradyrhizobium diazoefficiens]|nr:hypothetical protein [Bradyrhizobium diazoefficiens]MBR0851677.1 hypothetical protein [Bradyrhizobium diazoefficiens]